MARIPTSIFLRWACSFSAIFFLAYCLLQASVRPPVTIIIDPLENQPGSNGLFSVRLILQSSTAPENGILRLEMVPAGPVECMADRWITLPALRSQQTEVLQMVLRFLETGPASLQVRAYYFFPDGRRVGAGAGNLFFLTDHDRF